MKRFILSIVIATTLTFTSCQFDDTNIWDKLNEYGESIKSHENRIAVLEELCKQMNTNISSLQTLVSALESKDYITNCSPVRKDGEIIGYTITFAHSDTITIYHGEDGTNGIDGQNGKDGNTPQIGVMKDTDGIYYWTVDGEWLLDGKSNKIKAVGTDGKDGANGTDGKDGQDGTNGSNGSDGKDGVDGTNGKDGITPQLKIENDYWFVSYDNGSSWTELGKATGEDVKDGNDGANGSDGADGEDGKDGDSIFKSVTQDDEYVYFNLSDGTMITLPKHDKENIQFEDLRVKAICCKNWDTNNDGELSYEEAAAVTDIGSIFKEDTNIIAFTELKYFTGITELSLWAFGNCTNLLKIVLPENVQTIGIRAFSGCSSLTSITIPNSVTSIGDRAFYGCSGELIIDSKIVEENYTSDHCPPEYGWICGADFTKLTIGNNVTSIGAHTFSGCSSLTSVTIPDSVTSIGSSAFSKCSSLTSVYCEPTTPPIGNSSMFANNASGRKIYVPTASVEAYKSAEYWSKYADYFVGYDFE